MLLIPVALSYTFGRMVGDTRQGWALLAAMLILFVPLVLLGVPQPSSTAIRCSPRWASTRSPAPLQAGGNMEGKETRFGIAASALFAAVTTGDLAARSTACTIRSRRWAASCRCS